ncbi:class E sortase [Prauserella coralliicola]|uniref:Class E sortase n=2 Tax=Prauserella TaxID=142577 RepID=A0A318L944_9PSEU|nr:MULTISPECIES: class E sortase [Prauserella]PXY17573.1 class E sortase [Prauserella flavalba]PXY18608.1 class E sortase [Prauserella coralliicola]TKG63615.1 class E sortase [Prauserella endophytica]
MTASRPGSVRRTIRVVGELLVTIGIVVLLFVVYQVYVTDWVSAGKQREASAELDDRWSREREVRATPIDGKAFARIFIPSFGADYEFTIQEGVDPATLAIGPGHYKDTALPGEPGNFAVAGHRVGKGAPFNDLDLLNSCDAIVIETADRYFVYRVLPMKEEMASWEERKRRRPKCANVSTLRVPSAADGGPYGATFGRVIVTPDRRDAVAPVPYQARAGVPVTSRAPLLTLTTCHPKFSARLRMIIHAVLTDEFQKRPSAGYADLLGRIGEA